MPRYETLHVAALPYPTSQGTQAAIGMMLDALTRAGRSTALLTYASGAGAETRFAHLTPSGHVKPRSLRSGPSLEKIVADVELAEALARLAHDSEVVVAHHVEAAAIAHALDLRRWVFVAHTVLAPELPTYLPRAIGRLASRMGDALDRRLVRAAPATAAISPNVAASMRALGAREPIVLPVPFDRITPSQDRASARAELGLSASDRVVLYAGNLDRYQGLPSLMTAMLELRATRPDVRLLVASESDPSALAGQLARRGLRHAFAPLATELDRARAHAAADVAVVPRAVPGGFPIKLLDAVARGTPVVAVRRAMSGSAFDGVRIVDDDVVALAHGLRAVLDAPPDTSIAMAHLSRAHAATTFLDAIDTIVARATSVSSSRD